MNDKTDTTKQSMEERLYTFWREEIIIAGNNGKQPIYTLNHGIGAFEEFIKSEIALARAESERELRKKIEYDDFIYEPIKGRVLALFAPSSTQEGVAESLGETQEDFTKNPDGLEKYPRVGRSEETGRGE